MIRFTLRGAVVAGLVIALAVPKTAHAEYQPVLHLMPEGAAPQLQLMPDLVDAKTKKKKKKPAPAPTPDTSTPAPDLGTSPSPDSSAPEPESPSVSPAPVVKDVPAASSSSSSSGGDMNFDLLGESKPRERSAAELAIAHDAEVRRTTLTIHQTAGLATLGLLAATVLVGQLNYMDKFAGSAPSNSAKWEAPHTVLAFATLGGFAATGMLGLFAPVPYDKPVKADTTLAHKLCMGAATLGMMSELGLGVYTASREGYTNQKSIAQAHQIIGFSTLVFMSAGASAFLF
ncbi:MAG: hypothetical protein JST54_21225 [Deltaproteobacteria bacterium]|nr:hypothetical protein [Deltaproteobacteria bacterium]